MTKRPSRRCRVEITECLPLLTAFGTGSGALGTTVAVALADSAKRSRANGDAAGFVYDQQFAFWTLLPLAALAVLVSLLGKRERD